MRHFIFYFMLFSLLSSLTLSAKNRVYDMVQFGLLPDQGVNSSPIFLAALQKIEEDIDANDRVTLRFAKGRYDFHEEGAARKCYYISNHDQTNPKAVALALENWNNLTIEGNGADFIFHGTMLPIALTHSKNCILKDFSIDFENPHITQIRVVENHGERGLTFEVAPWVNYRIGENGMFESYGEGWVSCPNSGIVFEGRNRHIVGGTSDLFYTTAGVKEIAPRRFFAPQWKDPRFAPGMVIAMRNWKRPTPGIFLSHNQNTHLENVKVHYAQGMGLLAQLCEDITLEGFGVCLRGDDDPRYFTTQADATHFSGCKGKISSCNGLYEGMMDDAINVHGTYLKIVKRIDAHTVIGRYMHDQAWGFTWGHVGDKVQFVKSATMETIGKNRVTAITPDDQDEVEGARTFRISFAKALPDSVSEAEGYGIENLEWTPEVYFAGNIIRNNRARGALFSTPCKVVVEDNLFDHTSGTAILLCGDCNGWYETGACRDVTIRRNRFINALTSQFQFTNAIISIYPEIPNLKNQTRYFHGGRKSSITISDNCFETFDAPILYAKSVDGLRFTHNTIRKTKDYRPFHWNTHRFFFERVIRYSIKKNDFEGGFDPTEDIRIR